MSNVTLSMKMSPKATGALFSKACRLEDDNKELRQKLEQRKSPWIKCEDQLPPMNKEFDAWHRSGERLANHGAYVGSWDDEFRAEVLRLNGITHWMEVPAGPVE